MNPHEKPPNSTTWSFGFLALLIVAVALTLPFQNCARTPTGSTTQQLILASGSFNHAGTTENCAACHQNDLTNSHRRTDGRDCSACHLAASWLPGDFQLDGPGHQPKANECVMCHEFERPSVTQMPDGQGIVSGHFAGTDCIQCHQPIVPAFDYQHVNATKAPVTSCLPCHQAVGQAAHPGQPSYFTGTGSCQTCHNSSGW